MVIVEISKEKLLQWSILYMMLDTNSKNWSFLSYPKFVDTISSTKHTLSSMRWIRSISFLA